MFSSNSSKKSLRENAVTILNTGCHFAGKLYCKGSTRIGGRIDGEIISEGLLIVEETATLSASIIADEAIVQGTVKGKLKAKRVELAQTCRFEGDITAPVLSVIEGAQFNGRSQMNIEDTANIAGGLSREIDAIAGLSGAIYADKIPDLKPDPQHFDGEREPQLAVMKIQQLTEQLT